MCRRGNQTHDLLLARQTLKPLGQQRPQVYRSETYVLINDKIALHIHIFFVLGFMLCRSQFMLS